MAGFQDRSIRCAIMESDTTPEVKGGERERWGNKFLLLCHICHLKRCCREQINGLAIGGTPELRPWDVGKAAGRGHCWPPSDLRCSSAIQRSSPCRSLGALPAASPSLLALGSADPPLSWFSSGLSLRLPYRSLLLLQLFFKPVC